MPAARECSRPPGQWRRQQQRAWRAPRRQPQPWQRGLWHASRSSAAAPALHCRWWLVVWWHADQAFRQALAPAFSKPALGSSCWADMSCAWQQAHRLIGLTTCRLQQKCAHVLLTRSRCSERCQGANPRRSPRRQLRGRLGALQATATYGATGTGPRVAMASLPCHLSRVAEPHVCFPHITSCPIHSGSALRNPHAAPVQTEGRHRMEWEISKMGGTVGQAHLLFASSADRRGRHERQALGCAAAAAAAAHWPGPHV